MTLRLNGSSSGHTEIKAPAAAGDNTITLPTSNGSAEQFLKNSGTAGELEYSSMVETSTGVGIGTSSPAHKVHVADASAPELIVEDTTNNVKTFIGAANTIGRIGTGSDHPLVFDINDSEKARLDSSGRFMLGTTTEGYSGAQTLTVAATGNAGITIRSGTSNNGTIAFSDATSGDAEYDGYIQYSQADQQLRFATDSTERWRIGSGGETQLRPDDYGLAIRSIAGSSSVTTFIFGAHSSSGMGLGTGTFEVYTNGDVKNTNNSYGQLSDQRLKENIVDAPSQWDDIKALQIRKYNFREGNGYDTHTQIGLVAQEAETVCPGLVRETPVREDANPVLDADGNELDATKSVVTSVLYMKAVKALQEAQTRIETLETQNTAQQTQIDDLLARVTALEAA